MSSTKFPFYQFRPWTSPGCVITSPNVLGCVLLVCLLAGSPAFGGVDTNNEQQLITVLRSNASLQEKDAACARLKVIGTAKSVPALAPLLRDEQLSHSARYALESMDLAPAGRALADALKDTKGLTKAGIINSLAVRGEVQAVPGIDRALDDPDSEVAAAAANALGQMGAPAALKALLVGIKKSTGQQHAVEADALLRWGRRLVDNGHVAQAHELYRQLYDSEKAEGVRVAAYRGVLRTSTDGGLELMIHAIPGPPGPSQLAAFQIIHELPGSAATEALARLLPQLEPSLQVPVIGGLSQRGDTAATPAIAALASSPVAEVRLAALRALDLLGDASNVALLAQFGASGTPDEQRAARQALIDLRRGNVADAVLEQMSTADPAVLAELTRTLGERGEKSAVPKLFALADRGPAPVTKAAFQALGELADNPELAGLVRFVMETKDETARAEAAQALRTATQHIQAQQRRVDLEPLEHGLRGGSVEDRIALLPVCSAVVSPDVRLGLRRALQDSDPRVRDTAIRTLCDTTDPDLLEDLITEARTDPRENFRMLAINGGVRVATQEETVRISNGQRIAVLKSLLGAAAKPEEKRVVLCGLAEVPELESLHVVESMLDQPDVHTEASQAALKIAVAVPSGQAHEAMAVLNKALAQTTDDSTRHALQTALKQLEASADYLTDWQVAGPYRQTGQDYSALFDILFPPELENAQGVAWQHLPAASDPKRPWVMDLLKALGGQECAAYARTWVHCDQDTPARMELGSDDGIKVWLNGKQVHANNVARALKPGSDKVDVNLHSGWNQLLLKVTQHNAGWAFCARLLKTDGSPVEGLRCESTPRS